MDAQALQQQVQQLQAQLQQQQQDAQQQQQLLATQMQQLQQQLAAVQAPQVAPPQASHSAVQDDTRYLSRIKEFNGDTQRWHGWSFKFQAFVLSLDPEFERWLRLTTGANLDVDVVNAALGADDRVRSLRFFNLLILSMTNDSKSYKIVERAGKGQGAVAWRHLRREYEPETAGAQAGLMLKLMKTRFPATADIVDELNALDLLIERYETLASDVISDGVKVGVVQLALEHHQDYQEHLLRNATRLDTYANVVAELRTIIQAKTAINTDMQVDGGIGPKGKKGDGKTGRGATWGGGKQDHGKKGDGKTKGKNKDNDRDCHFCGKKGHIKKNCRAYAAKLKEDKEKAAVGGVDDKGEPRPKVEAGITEIQEPDEPIGDFVFMLATIGGCRSYSETKLCVDSGAARSVVPLGYAADTPIAASGTPLQTLAGQEVDRRGQKNVVLEGDNRSLMEVKVDEAGVLYPTLAVSSMTRGGLSVIHSCTGHSHVVEGPVALPRGSKSHALYEENGTYWWDVKRRIPYPEVLHLRERKR